MRAKLKAHILGTLHTFHPAITLYTQLIKDGCDSPQKVDYQAAYCTKSHEKTASQTALRSGSVSAADAPTALLSLQVAGFAESVTKNRRQFGNFRPSLLLHQSVKKEKKTGTCCTCS